MRHKYERNCWSCGSKGLEPDDRGVRCRKCGATWNELPETHHTAEPGKAFEEEAITRKEIHPELYVSPASTARTETPALPGTAGATSGKTPRRARPDTGQSGGIVYEEDKG